MGRMVARVEEFVRSLGVDAYLVGGAVRDELLGRESKDADFLVRGLDHDGLRAALSPHGRVEELEVAGRRVGLRLLPRDLALREAAPAGIEFAPPAPSAARGPDAMTSRSWPIRPCRSTPTCAGATSR